MLKRDVTNANELEEYFVKSRKIKFEDYEPTDLEDLFFEYVLSNRDTYYSNGKLQCESGRYRSICEFVLISKYYFPDTTTKEILNVIKDNHQKENPKSAYYQKYSNIFRCNHIRKHNFMTTGYLDTPDFNKIFFNRDGFLNLNSSYADIMQ